VNPDLDNFLGTPAFKGNVLVRPSTTRRAAYAILMAIGALVAITGFANLVRALSGAMQFGSDTVTLATGLILIGVGLALIWRFSSPFVFAVGISDSGLAWRNLFGWHHAPWPEIDFALIRRHSRYGGHEVHIKSSDGRLHFGWTNPGERMTFGPLESLPADEGRALAHSIITRASLQQREPGVWVRESDQPIQVSTGQFQW
jgi:hypothetical protein